MAISPLVDKNAYLGVHISKDRISASLAYSHYSVGRSYVLSDTVRYDDEVDDISDQLFWDEYFNTLEERFNWELIEGSGNGYSLAKAVPFADEGKGISGVNIVVHYSIPTKVKLFSVLHTYLPTAKLTTTDGKYYNKVIPPIMSKLEYDDVVILDGDLEKFDLYRVELERDKRGDLITRTDQTKIHWDSKEHLIESINDKRLKAFSSVDTEQSSVINKWANFLISPIEKVDDQIIEDLLRSFFTVQLMSMFNNKKDLFARFGLAGRRSLFILTGRLATLLTGRSVVLGLVDGLQMRGSFDLLLDGEHRLDIFAEEYSRGINAHDYIVPRDVLVDPASRVFVVEVPGRKGEKRVAFSGEILSDGNKKDLFVLSPELVKLHMSVLDELPDDKVVLTGKFVKQAYVEGMDEEVTVVSDLQKLPISDVYFDARYKPAVYGPDFRSNIAKLRLWFGE